MVWLWNLQRVRYVSRLEKHLISIRQLDNISYLVNFLGGIWNISNRAMISAHGKKVGTLYMTSRLGNTIVSIEVENQVKI